MPKLSSSGLARCLIATADAAAVRCCVNQVESKFTITAKADQNKPKKWSPTIVGSNMRLENATSDNPQLVFGNHGEGEIFRVQFRGQGGNVDCQGPITSLKVWQDK